MRKKKLAILLLGFIAAASCAIGLAACGGNGGNGNEQGDGGTTIGGNEPQEHVHTFTYHGAVAATCTQSGNIEYWSCSECGKYFSDSTGTTEITGITVAALGHDWGEWTVTTAATCTTVGEETRVCSHDNNHTETREVAIDANNHDWGEWTVTTAATCTTVGEETRVCSHDSNHTETREVAKLPHTLTKVEALEATCTETGNIEYWVCSECGKYFSDENATTEITDITLDALGHDWGEWTVTTAATCTAVGEETRTCSHDSKHTETREIAQIPHTLVHHDAVEATCTETGNIEYWECSECGKYFSNENATTEITGITVAALGHDWGEWTVTTAATCTAVGEETRVCSHDSKHTETREIAIDEDNHDWGDWTTVTEATCTQEGEETRVCSHDNSHKETREVAKIPHTYEDGVCTVCGALEPTEGLEYTTYYSTYAAVTGIGTATDTDIVIADEYEGLPVTTIGASAFRGCTSLKSITIPDSVTSIGPYAFNGSNSLTNIYYGGDVEGWLSISGLSYLMQYGSSSKKLYFNNELATSITIPDTVTSIGNYAFNGCSSLESITIPDSVISIGEYAFSGCSAEIIWGDKPTITSIGSYAFYGYKGTSVTIPNSVTSIGNYAFNRCTSLTDIYYGGDVEGWLSISGLSNLMEYGSSSKNLYFNNVLVTSITIPDSVTSIGYYAFNGCSSLESITIPDSVTSIGNYAFEGCYKLVEVYNLSSLVITAGSVLNGYVGYYALDVYTSLDTESKLYTDDNGYTFYADGDTVYMVWYTGSDTELTLPESFNGKNYAINNYAFNGCGSLTSVTIGDSVTSIGSYAFNGCSSLTSVTIGNSVTYIGERAFNGCSSLTSVTIGNSVTFIGQYAFDGCYKLVEVYNLSSLTIKKGSSDNDYVGYYALGVYTSLDTQSKLYTDDNGYTFYEDGDTVYMVWYTGSDTELTLPDSFNGKNYQINKYAFCNDTSITSINISNGVTSIGDSAFRGCSGLTSITIPDGVTSIGSSAFYGCTSLESITIPDGVTSISDYAFYGCTSLTSVTIGNNVTSIGNYAFTGCSSLTSITIPDGVTSIGYCAFFGCNSLKSVTIPDGVTSIGERAFWSSSLTSVTIPNSVTSIGSYAFYNCKSLSSVTIGNSVKTIGSSAFYCSSLNTVYYNGTAEDWDNISIDSYGNTYLTNATRYYYSESEPEEEGNYWHYVDGEIVIWADETETA